MGIETEPTLAKTLESIQQGTVDPAFLLKNVDQLRTLAQSLNATAKAKLQSSLDTLLLTHKEGPVHTALEALRKMTTLEGAKELVGNGIAGKALDMGHRGVTGLAGDASKGVDSVASFAGKQISYFSDKNVPMKDKLLWGAAAGGILYGAKKIYDLSQKDTWGGKAVRWLGFGALAVWLLHRFAPANGTLAEQKKGETPASNPQAAEKPLPKPIGKENTIAAMPTPEPFRKAVSPIAPPSSEQPRLAA